MSYITLHSGRDYYLSGSISNPSAIGIEDIAHSLAHLCRFNGHASKFYSVAEHSHRASFLVPQGFALEALMHDAAEALIGDIARPLKRELQDILGPIEGKIEQELAKRFNLKYPWDSAILAADSALLVDEAKALIPSAGWIPDFEAELAPLSPPQEIPPGRDPVGLLAPPIYGLTPSQAKEQFIVRYVQLRDERDGIPLSSRTQLKDAQLSA